MDTARRTVLSAAQIVAMDGDHSGARYIAVEGPIGVGKTALARRLATECGIPFVPEHVEDNPFLRKFYEEPQRYAFQAQISFLLDRYRQQQELARHDVRRTGAVSDYLFAKDGIFAAINLHADELALYQEIFSLFDAQIPKPDLVVYLEARPEVLLKRIRKRDRDYERTIKPEYLERLTEAFRNYFHDFTDAPLLVVNCSDIDFVERSDDLADLIKEIRGMGQGVQHYIPLGIR